LPPAGHDAREDVEPARWREVTETLRYDARIRPGREREGRGRVAQVVDPNGQIELGCLEDLLEVVEALVRSQSASNVSAAGFRRTPTATRLRAERRAESCSPASTSAHFLNVRMLVMSFTLGHALGRSG
jgi:hypothetical protein